MDDDTTTGDLLIEVQAFADERNWGRFHTPPNLAQAISVEAGELLECFLWGDDWASVDAHRVSEEVADVLIYCMNLVNAYEWDLATIVRAKLARNADKYPMPAQDPALNGQEAAR